MKNFDKLTVGTVLAFALMFAGVTNANHLSGSTLSQDHPLSKVDSHDLRTELENRTYLIPEELKGPQKLLRLRKANLQ